MEDTPFWLYALVIVCFVLFPLLIAFFGLKVFLGALRFRKHGVWVPGTVVEVKKIRGVGETNSIDEYSYQPIFEFEAPDGSKLRGEAGSYGHTNEYPVGSQREILVDFENPDMVFMSASYRLYFGLAMILFGFGIASFVLYAFFVSDGG